MADSYRYGLRWKIHEGSAQTGRRTQQNQQIWWGQFWIHRQEGHSSEITLKIWPATSQIGRIFHWCLAEGHLETAEQHESEGNGEIGPVWPIVQVNLGWQILLHLRWWPRRYHLLGHFGSILFSQHRWHLPWWTTPKKDDDSRCLYCQTRFLLLGILFIKIHQLKQRGSVRRRIFRERLVVRLRKAGAAQLP